MTVTQYVALISWTSAFTAFWICFITDNWSAGRIVLIVFSFLVAVGAGLEINSQNQKKKKDG